MKTAIKRYKVSDPELEHKLELSRKLAEILNLRTIRCPCCGFYMLDVYGHDHYLVRVKCRKCKFSEVIDTALFRTVKGRQRLRLGAYDRDCRSIRDRD